MTDRFRLVGSLALAALVAGGAYRAGARLPELGIDRSPLKEHVEAAAKRARFETAARARALHMLRRLVGDATFFPALRATYRTSADASTVTLAVTQTQGHTVVHPAAGPHDKPFYVFPLPVRITYLDGTTYDVILDLDGVTTSVTFPNPSKKFVAGIALDPAKDLLRIVESTGPA